MALATTEFWVAPEICCGLGNRLFQTLAAIGFAEKIGRTPVFFLPRMGKSEHGNFELLFRFFPNIEIVETSPEWTRLCEKDILNGSFIPSSLSHEMQNLTLNGFFQNSLFFPSLSSTNKYLPILPGATIKGLDTKKWAVHFRFGDYQELSHYQFPLEYYYGYLIRKIPFTSSILLFSDTPSKLVNIRNEIKSWGYSSVGIYESDDLLLTMQEFAKCQAGSICSNSTFAWWCAYFAWKTRKDGDYFAYFPEQWIVSEESSMILIKDFCIPISFFEYNNAGFKVNSFSYL